MIEFELDGQQYRAEKLTGMEQFHVQRRIAPLLPPLIPLAVEMLKSVPAAEIASGKASAGVLLQHLPRLYPLLQHLADSLATLPDEQLDYVVRTCLSRVKRKRGDNWAQAWEPKTNAPMFDDMQDSALIVRLVVRVVLHSLGPFIRGLLTGPQETATAALTQ